MITDDHKTVTSTSTSRHSDFSNGFPGMEAEWSQVGGILNELTAADIRAPSKRKKDVVSNSIGKKRPKPYDSSSKPNRSSREGSLSSIPSPSTSHATLPLTRSPTPPSLLQQFLTPEPARPSLVHGSETSSPDSLVTPLDHSPDVHMPEAHPEPPHDPHTLSLPIVMPTHPHPMPFMFFDTNQGQQSLSTQLPTIHRLIPNMGPTHGGIEVTVLGANFHASLQLNCIFGDIAASSTQRWSDNTLVCVLPPRATAGVVAVWFDGLPKLEDQINAPPSLFTYADESDRALLVLSPAIGSA